MIQIKKIAPSALIHINSAARESGSNSGIYDRVYDPTWINFQTNVASPNPAPAFSRNEDVDDEDFFGGQIFAKWQVSDTFSVSPKFMYQKIEADGLPFADRRQTPHRSLQRLSRSRCEGG